MATAKDVGRIAELLKQKVAELKEPDKQYYDAPAFARWEYETESIIRNHFGPDSPQLREFHSALSRQKPGIHFNVFDSSAEWETKRQETHLYRMPYLEAVINGIISELDSGVTPVRVMVGSPKAFVAHGGESDALGKLEAFLSALGVEPLVVEGQPSEGRSVNENVEYYFNQSDCAIILATKGDIDGKTGEFIPRGNISIEVGMCLQRLPNKTIYLLEEGAKFPSDISEKVWEPFTQDNMENAFIKVAKELRAFDLIRAIKPSG